MHFLCEQLVRKFLLKFIIQYAMFPNWWADAAQLVTGTWYFNVNKIFCWFILYRVVRVLEDKVLLYGYYKL